MQLYFKLLGYFLYYTVHVCTYYSLISYMVNWQLIKQTFMIVTCCCFLYWYSNLKSCKNMKSAEKKENISSVLSEPNQEGDGLTNLMTEIGQGSVSFLEKKETCHKMICFVNSLIIIYIVTLLSCE